MVQGGDENIIVVLHFLRIVNENHSLTGPVWGIGISGRARIKEWCRRVNMVKILYTHV
jgi:hypothetical protein